MDRNEIINKKFPHAFLGYDVSEVDLFLDEVIREMDRMNNEKDIESFRAEASRQREDALKAHVEMLRQKLIAANIPFDDEVALELEPVQINTPRPSDEQIADAAKHSGAENADGGE